VLGLERDEKQRVLKLSCNSMLVVRWRFGLIGTLVNSREKLLFPVYNVNGRVFTGCVIDPYGKGKLQTAFSGGARWQREIRRPQNLVDCQR
jgi:hypothetical protein